MNPFIYRIPLEVFHDLGRDALPRRGASYLGASLVSTSFYFADEPFATVYRLIIRCFDFFYAHFIETCHGFYKETENIEVLKRVLFLRDMLIRQPYKDGDDSPP